MVEPEWTERYRNLVGGLALYEQQTCPGCSLHPTVLANPALHLELEDTFCDMCKAKDRHRRRLEARDLDFEQQHKDIQPGAPRPNDGIHVRLRSLTPAEVKARQEKAERIASAKDKQRRRTDG